MAGQGLKELVGRAMIDPDFLESLRRDPAAVLADYQLTPEEERSVRQALARLAAAPPARRAREFQSALVKRWAV
jgi:hypothetical protein